MNKTIQLTIGYPYFIHAIDSEGQFMNITRKVVGVNDVSDSDECSVISARQDPTDPNDLTPGTCTWGDAFRAIADFMNATTLD